MRVKLEFRTEDMNIINFKGLIVNPWRLENIFPKSTRKEANRAEGLISGKSRVLLQRCCLG